MNQNEQIMKDLQAQSAGAVEPAPQKEQKMHMLTNSMLQDLATDVLQECKSITGLVKILVSKAFCQNNTEARMLIGKVIHNDYAIYVDAEPINDTKVLKNTVNEYIDAIKKRLEYTTSTGAVVTPKKVAKGIYQFVQVSNLTKLADIFILNALDSHTPIIVDLTKFYCKNGKKFELSNLTDNKIREIQDSEKAQKETEKAQKEYKHAVDLVSNSQEYAIVDKDAKIWNNMNIVDKVTSFMNEALELGIILTPTQLETLQKLTEPSEQVA